MIDNKTSAQQNLLLRAMQPQSQLGKAAKAFALFGLAVGGTVALGQMFQLLSQASGWQKRLRLIPCALLSGSVVLSADSLAQRLLKPDAAQNAPQSSPKGSSSTESASSPSSDGSEGGGGVMAGPELDPVLYPPHPSPTPCLSTEEASSLSGEELREDENPLVDVLAEISEAPGEDESPIASLPPELLTHVLDQLPTKALAQSRQVCRQWKRVADFHTKPYRLISYYKLNRKIDKNLLSPTSLSSLYAYLDKTGQPFPEVLDFSGCTLSQEIMAAIPTPVPWLNLSGCTLSPEIMAAIPLILAARPGMGTLTLSDCALSPQIMAAIPLTIEALNLSGCILSTEIMAAVPQSTDWLVLSGCTLSPEIVAAVPSGVDSLTLSGCTLSAEIMAAISPTTKHLHLNGCTLSTEIMEVIPIGITNLYLFNCEGISDADIRDLRDRFLVIPSLH